MLLVGLAPNLNLARSGRHTDPPYPHRPPTPRYTSGRLHHVPSPYHHPPPAPRWLTHRALSTTCTPSWSSFRRSPSLIDVPSLFTCPSHPPSLRNHQFCCFYLYNILVSIDGGLRRPSALSTHAARLCAYVPECHRAHLPPQRVHELTVALSLFLGLVLAPVVSRLHVLIVAPLRAPTMLINDTAAILLLAPLLQTLRRASSNRPKAIWQSSRRHDTSLSFRPPSTASLLLRPGRASIFVRSPISSSGPRLDASPFAPRVLALCHPHFPRSTRQWRVPTIPVVLLLHCLSSPSLKSHTVFKPT